MPRLAPVAVVVALLLAASGCWQIARAQCGAPIDLGRGPILFHVPWSYDPSLPAPLIVVLHGYGSNPRQMAQYIQMVPVAEESGFLVAFPEGTPDITGRNFWDATDVCCGRYGPDRDDSGYLRRLVEQIQSQCNVDPQRIFFIGHSNGGYMSYRMACDHAELISAIVPIAGVTAADPLECQPSQPVHVLHIHGTADELWRFEGGSVGGVEYLSVPETVARWSGHNGCRAALEESPERLDLDLDLPGPDTDVARVRGCRAGGSVELWSVIGADHTPNFDRPFARRLADHLLAHGRSCAGGEQVARARCRRGGRLKLALRGGLSRDAYRVTLSSGESAAGALDPGGNARLAFRGLPAASGEATVIWGCGVRERIEYRCR